MRHPRAAPICRTPEAVKSSSVAGCANLEQTPLCSDDLQLDRERDRLRARRGRMDRLHVTGILATERVSGG